MPVLSVGGWATGAGAVVVLVATAAWVVGPGDVDDRLWGEVRPVIETRLAAEARGSGYGETVPELRARWFCRAEALELEERDDAVRAGVATLCVEYGVHAGALVECSAGYSPQIVRLERDGTAPGGYRILSREAPPDGEGYGQWTKTNFGHLAGSALEDPISADTLEAEARTHFKLPADTTVGEC